ncbi:MAG: hypothetical protein JO342_04375 [Solirubrobacterales bacterium]|nr:hypothetical protein [Solirubrobacterales bacterium]
MRYERIGLGARSDDIAAMYRYLDRTCYQVDTAAVRAQFPEVAWRSFAEWAQQQLRG